ncbi:tetratricopeptide repeat protein [Mastigocoleus testarum]|uniref:Tetratricopeptide repeat protein n=1 Tax=Mastigocoleus testarum BC008 TaxID=371196 RepID=A0A0V7ZTJ5_9CYAN|nr:hypothetical protein [Mastigocoleus testarum]KST67713.1 hypothetical protein BC008_43955 [Mastigocoleus testarum BC008]
MKKNLVTITTLITLGLIAFAKPALSNLNPLNIIVAIAGNVQIKRPQWTEYKPVSIGTLVNPSDKLRLTKGASVKVQCTNLDVWDLGSPGEFPISQACPSSRPVLRRPNSKTTFTRGGNDSTVPYPIIPRNTKILTGQPKLRWNPVAGVTKYQVRLFGPDVDWETSVNQPWVVYNDKEQPLKPGSRYWLTVATNNGVTTKNQDNGFTVMSEADSQRVKAEIAKLQQQGLKGEGNVLALAHLYRSNDLHADAIDLLSEFIQKSKSIQKSAVHQLLANTYQQVGLNLLSRQQYLTALELARTEKNLEAQAIIQGSLGEIDFSFNKLQDALRWYQAAQVGYQELGDRTKADELQQKVNQLKGRV